jgi:hypothetical protein
MFIGISGFTASRSPITPHASTTSAIILRTNTEAGQMGIPEGGTSLACLQIGSRMLAFLPRSAAICLCVSFGLRFNRSNTWVWHEGDIRVEREDRTQHFLDLLLHLSGGGSTRCRRH